MIVVVIVIVTVPLICVAVCMRMIVASMGVPVVSMVKRHDTDQVDHQSEPADSQ